MVTRIRQAAFDIARGVAACPHLATCSREFHNKFPSRDGEKPTHFAPTPSPDFIGSRYAGLVIVGGNPGLAHQGVHHEKDARMFALQKRIALGEQAAFDELLAFMPDSMAHWPQVVDRGSRAMLRYDIEHVAYIDIVKCGTRPAQGDTHSLMKRTGILNRCWEQHTRKLLDLLQPTHILALWTPTLRVLQRLGYDIDSKIVGHHSGARHLTKIAKYANAHPVVDDFYRRSQLGRP